MSKKQPGTICYNHDVQPSAHDNICQLQQNLLNGQFYDIMKGFLIVEFDTKTGPKITFSYPNSLSEFLLTEDMTALCFGCMPEHENSVNLFNSFINCIEDGKKEFPKPKARHSTMQYKFRLAGNINYYVQFIRSIDETRDRGYLQSSLVVVSERNWDGLFFYVLTIIQRHLIALRENSAANIFHINSDVNKREKEENLIKPLFEVVCHNINAWNIKPIVAGNHNFPDQTEKQSQRQPKNLLAELPLLGDIYEVNFSAFNPTISPLDGWLNGLFLDGLFASKILAPLHNQQSLFIAWECVVLGDPLVIYGKTPEQLYQFIHSLLQLCSYPIDYTNQLVKYYVTMQDPFTKTIIETAGNDGSPPRNLIVGVTNPMLRESFYKWPNFIDISSIRSGGFVKSSTLNDILVPKGHGFNQLNQAACDEDETQLFHSASLLSISSITESIRRMFKFSKSQTHSHPTNARGEQQLFSTPNPPLSSNRSSSPIATTIKRVLSINSKINDGIADNNHRHINNGDVCVTDMGEIECKFAHIPFLSQTHNPANSQSDENNAEFANDLRRCVQTDRNYEKGDKLLKNYFYALQKNLLFPLEEYFKQPDKK